MHMHDINKLIRFKYFNYSLVVLVTIIFLSIVYYQCWARFNICPIFDGNNCIARVSNVGLLLERHEFSGFFLKLQQDLNNFLSVIYFSIFSAFVGPGRAAWGWAWSVACLALVIFQINVLKPTIKWWQVLLAFLLLLVCSPILSPSGGLLDQRLDLFSILFFLAAAASLYSQRLVWAFYLSIMAIYAKGPALPVFLIFWLSAYLSKMISLKQIMQSMRQYKLAYMGCVVLLGIYGVYFLQTVISYNLMAVKTSDHSSTGAMYQFILSAIRNTIISHFFYIKSLCARSPFFFVLVFLVIGIFYQKRTEMKDEQRHLIIWGFSLFFLTYVLFSSHPVRDRVLDIWFLPSIWIFSLVVSYGAVRSYFLYGAFIIFIGIKLFFTFNIVFTSGPNKNPIYQQYCGRMFEQANSLANILEKKSNISQKTIRILPNFLKAPIKQISFSYDTYRVLLFEALGKNSPLFEGWELGTYSDNWISEISRMMDHEVFLGMIVVDGKDNIHFRNKANKLATEYIGKVNMSCEIKNVQGAKVPDFGLFRFFLTEGGFNKCL